MKAMLTTHFDDWMKMFFHISEMFWDPHLHILKDFFFLFTILEK